MKKGDILIVNFPFTDTQDRKKRPALILHSNEDEVICAFITSNTTIKSTYDINLKKDSVNNLPKDSIIRLSKLASISKFCDESFILGDIGEITKSKTKEVDMALKYVFDL